MSIASQIFFKKNTCLERQTNSQLQLRSSVYNLVVGHPEPRYITYVTQENNKEAEIVKELKILKLLNKIEKQMRITKFEPEAAKSILAFQLAPSVQIASSSSKAKTLN